MSDRTERSEGGTEVVEQITKDPIPENKDTKNKRNEMRRERS